VDAAVGILGRNVEAWCDPDGIPASCVAGPKAQMPAVQPVSSFGTLRAEPLLPSYSGRETSMALVP
jgi:hypothetical protein